MLKYNLEWCVKMKKIIVSDFDDTIYVNQKIEKETVKLIHKFRKDGDLLIIATGSSYPSLISKIGNSGLEYDYLICDHGCNIMKDEKLVYYKLIDNNIVDELIESYKLDKTNNNFAISKNHGNVGLDNKEISKIHISFKNKGDDFKAKEELNKKYSNLINVYCLSNYYNSIEIINGKCSKLNAMAKIIELENISDYKIYPIGDGYSDIEMVKKYNGYCVKNAVSELKKISSKIYNNFQEFIIEIINE